MSLILEALRKSEAERRRGLPPDLHAELPPPPARRVPAGAGWWLATAATCLALAGWLLLREPAAPRSPAPAPADAVAPAEPSAPSPPALPARTPAAATRPASSPASPAPGADTSQPQVPPQERATPATPDRAQTPAAAPAPTTAKPAAIPVDPAPPPGQTDASRAPAAVPADSPAPAGDGRVLSLSDLDPGTRKALPPLKLSMHLWNPDPSRRFVILDGQRLGEGDRVGEASIVRIERDGVLLEWHGRGVRVPVH